MRGLPADGNDLAGLLTLFGSSELVFSRFKRSNDEMIGYDDDGREVMIRMQLEEVDRQSLQQLRNMTFPTADGKEVPLESLASIYVEQTLGRPARTLRQFLGELPDEAPAGSDPFPSR